MNPDPRLTSDRLENTIVLASASPRRSQLLASAGIAFTVVGI